MAVAPTAEHAVPEPLLHQVPLCAVQDACETVVRESAETPMPLPPEPALCSAMVNERAVHHRSVSQGITHQYRSASRISATHILQRDVVQDAM